MSKYAHCESTEELLFYKSLLSIVIIIQLQWSNTILDEKTPIQS